MDRNSLPPTGTQSSDLVVRALSSTDAWDHENAFYWFSHPTRLGKLLAHFDLYRSIVGIPGDVLELGVYKGASLIRLASFRQALENDFSRKLVGFDAFGRFPIERLSMREDLAFVKGFESGGGDGLSVEELTSILRRKGFNNWELVQGNVFETVPEYLAKHPAARVAFLHLDMDVKEPTIDALQHLYSRVVPGGVIVIDDYGAVAGATEAIDEFVGAKGLRLEKLPYYKIPSFLRKPI